MATKSRALALLGLSWAIDLCAPSPWVPYLAVGFQIFQWNLWQTAFNGPLAVLPSVWTRLICASVAHGEDFKLSKRGAAEIRASSQSRWSFPEPSFLGSCLGPYEIAIESDASSLELSHVACPRKDEARQSRWTQQSTLSFYPLCHRVAYKHSSTFLWKDSKTLGQSQDDLWAHIKVSNLVHPFHTLPRRNGGPKALHRPLANTKKIHLPENSLKIEDAHWLLRRSKREANECANMCQWNCKEVKTPPHKSDHVKAPYESWCIQSTYFKDL